MCHPLCVCTAILERASGALALTQGRTRARLARPQPPRQMSMQGEARQDRVVFIACNDSLQSLPADLLRHLHHLLAKPEVRLTDP